LALKENDKNLPKFVKIAKNSDHSFRGTNEKMTPQNWRAIAPEVRFL
jgi:hypothetical protein